MLVICQDEVSIIIIIRLLRDCSTLSLMNDDFVSAPKSTFPTTELTANTGDMSWFMHTYVPRGCQLR